MGKETRKNEWDHLRYQGKATIQRTNNQEINKGNSEKENVYKRKKRKGRGKKKLFTI